MMKGTLPVAKGKGKGQDKRTGGAGAASNDVPEIAPKINHRSRGPPLKSPESVSLVTPTSKEEADVTKESGETRSKTLHAKAPGSNNSRLRGGYKDHATSCARQACRAFSRGTCWKGLDCKYRHDETAARQDDDKDSKDVVPSVASKPNEASKRFKEQLEAANRVKQKSLETAERTRQRLKQQKVEKNFDSVGGGERPLGPPEERAKTTAPTAPPPPVEETKPPSWKQAMRQIFESLEKVPTDTNRVPMPVVITWAISPSVANQLGARSYTDIRTLFQSQDVERRGSLSFKQFFLAILVLFDVEDEEEDQEEVKKGKEDPRKKMEEDEERREMLAAISLVESLMTGEGRGGDPREPAWEAWESFPVDPPLPPPSSLPIPPTAAAPPMPPTQQSTGGGIDQDIASDEELISYFHQIAWLKAYEMRVYRWAGNASEWHTWALVLRPDVVALVDAALDYLKDETGCDVSIEGENLDGTFRQFLKLPRGTTGSATNDLLEAVLGHLSRMLEGYLIV